MGGGTLEELDVARNTVVSTRTPDGRISLSPLIVKYDSRSAVGFLEQWIKKAEVFKEQAALIGPVTKEFINLARFEAIMPAIFLGNHWWLNLPEAIAVFIAENKARWVYLKSSWAGRNLLKEAAAGKEIILFVRLHEMPEGSCLEGEMFVTAGITALPLKTGYSFDGQDVTGRFPASEDIEGKLIERACPSAAQWAHGQLEKLGGVSEEELKDIIFPLVLMMETAAELAGKNARFKVMAIYESQIGRQVLEIVAENLKKLGIVNDRQKAF